MLKLNVVVYSKGHNKMKPDFAYTASRANIQQSHRKLELINSGSTPNQSHVSTARKYFVSVSMGNRIAFGKMNVFFTCTMQGIRTLLQHNVIERRPVGRWAVSMTSKIILIKVLWH